MGDDLVSIEGLWPWAESGQLGEVIKNYASWIDGAPDQVEATLQVRQWGVSDRPDLHLRPVVEIRLTFGPKGYRGEAVVRVWRGADPRRLGQALDEATDSAAGAHAVRKREGTTYVVEETLIELFPGG